MAPVRRVVKRDKSCELLCDVTWEDAVEAFLRSKRSKSENTIRFYRIQLSTLIQWVGAEEISLGKFRKADMDRYMDFRKAAGLKPTTRRHDAVASKAFFRYCVIAKYRLSNPLADFCIPKAAVPYKRVPTTEEINTLLNSIKDFYLPSKHPGSKYLPLAVRTFHARRNYAILCALTDCACRVGEMLSLQLDDVDLGNRTLAFRTTKGGEPRRLPFSAKVGEVFAEYLKVRPSCDSTLFFVTEHGMQISVNSFDKKMLQYLEFAGLSRFTIHSIRHYAITKLAQRDLYVASEMAGHKSLEVTRLYVHSDPEHFRVVHESASPLNGVIRSKRKPQVRENLLR